MPLDPTTFNSLVQIYQRELDSLIENLGKDIEILYSPTTTLPNEIFNDLVRDESIKFPSFKASSLANQPTEVENTEIIRALIKHTPKEYTQNAYTKINQPDGILRLKTYLIHLPKLQKAEYIIPHIESLPILYSRYRKLGEPIPVGLKYDRYCISFWERI